MNAMVGCVPVPVLAVLATVVLAAGCRGLGAWLDQPVGQGVQRGDQTVTVTDPQTDVTVTAPTAPNDTATIDLPDGGTATYTPPAPSGEPTQGDVIADTAGGIAGAVTGNPMLAILTTAALKAAMGFVPRKRQPQPVAA